MESMKNSVMITTLQLSIKKDTGTTEVVTCLCPLLKSVYDELLHANYKTLVFTKFDGDGRGSYHNFQA